MNTNTTDKPDFGEPWIPQNQGDHLWIALREESNIVGDIVCDAPGAEYSASLAHWPDRAQRILACVNACAGMADPATEIQAMRAALEEAYEALKAIDDLHNYDFPHVGDFSDTAIEAFNKGNATLAKLKPLLNP